MIKHFFEPKSVAVIGASDTPPKGGYHVMNNLINYGFKGKIFPVNPGKKEILGCTVYRSIKELPEAAELAVIVIPRDGVLQALRECADKGIQSIIISSGGFSDADDEKGKEMARQVSELVRQLGLKIMGPNSLGVIDLSSGLNTTFGPLGVVKKGDIALLGQTGLFATGFIRWIHSGQYFGLSKVVSLGNKSDIDESDVLEYVANDSDTRVIAMYLEGVRDGKRFYKLAAEISKSKPIIVIKSGRTERGRRSMLSHTGTLAGDDNVFNALCKQAGIIRVYSFQKLFDLSKAFSYLSLPLDNNIAIISGSGASGVIGSEYAAERGLELPEFNENTVRKLKGIFPEWAPVKNPLDIWVAIEMVGYNQTIPTCLNAVADDPRISSIVLAIAAPFMEFDLAGIVENVRRKYPQKCLVVCFVSGSNDIAQKNFAELEKARIPCYFWMENAISVISKLCQYRDYLRRQD